MAMVSAALLSPLPAVHKDQLFIKSVLRLQYVCICISVPAAIVL